jgi:hypothetical protein
VAEQLEDGFAVLDQNGWASVVDRDHHRDPRVRTRIQAGVSDGVCQATLASNSSTMRRTFKRQREIGPLHLRS